MKTWCVMKPEAPASYRGVQADAYSGDPLGYAGGSRPFPQLCADLNNGKWASKRPGESMQNFPNINMYGIIGVHIYIYRHIILSYTVCVHIWERERDSSTETRNRTLVTSVRPSKSPTVFEMGHMSGNYWYSVGVRQFYTKKMVPCSRNAMSPTG